MDSPLPSNWTPESKVRFTATVLEKPEFTDTKTIIRHGIWYITLKGYAEIIPGSRVTFVGKVEPKVLMGKITQIVMKDPTFEAIPRVNREREYRISNLMILLNKWREKWVGILEKTLPEPMSSLAAGILLGVKGQMPKEFYDDLVSTGTLHIVAASGYNVSIVAAVMMKVVITVVSRGLAIGIGITGIIIYVLVAGSSASVVRAGIMGSLTLIAYYFGRPTEARRLLWVTGAIMLLLDPLMLVNIGFQLSFVATAGLLYIVPWIHGRKSSDPRLKSRKDPNFGVWSELLGQAQGFLAEYLYPTLAATIATLPVIIYHFGRVSIISSLVNILVLPLVPLVMGMTALVIGLGSISLLLGQVLAWALYGPLAWIVYMITLFGKP